MAEFNRKELKKIFEAAEIEVPKDVLGQLCDLHTDSEDGKGDTIKDLKARLSKAEKERDEALEKVPAEGEETVSKAKFDKLQTEYDEYKTGVETKEAKAKKTAAVRDLLKESGISEKRLDAVLRVYDLEGVELDEHGKIKDATERTESIKKDWADFIVETHQQGANTGNPPDNNGGNVNLGELSMADYIAARKKG